MLVVKLSNDLNDRIRMFILTSFEKRQFDIRQLNANKLLQHGSQSERLETLKAWMDNLVVLFSNVYKEFIAF